MSFPCCDGRWQAELRALLVSVPPTQMRPWLSGLYDDPRSRDVAIRAVVMAGDYRRMEWILAQMAAPDSAQTVELAMIDMFPDAAEDETLWSTDAKQFPPAYLAHFGDALPRLSLPGAMARTFADQAGKAL